MGQGVREILCSSAGIAWEAMKTQKSQTPGIIEGAAAENSTAAPRVPAWEPPRVTPARRRRSSADRLRNFGFVVSSLVMRDFKVRYRNMSLGVLWSLANPLVMMLVLTFVFSRVFHNSQIKSYPAFVLCGLIPFNFFLLAWGSGTSSIYLNSGLVKRVRVQLEIIPISAILAQGIHFLIQMALLLVLVMALGFAPDREWLWIIPISLMELVAVAGLALGCSACDVYLRDTRYIVDSIGTILFWLSPVFYPASLIPQSYRLVYESNPIAATIICMRRVLLDGESPGLQTFGIGIGVSVALFAGGLAIFRWLKGNFGDHL